MQIDVQNILKEMEVKLASDDSWKVLCSPNMKWKEDPVFSKYHALSTKVKGKVGEKYTAGYFIAAGREVKKPQNSGHDRIVDGIKTEIKFSLANTIDGRIVHDKFMINHVSVCKNWERLVFVGINPMDAKVRVRAYFMEKEDFVKHMKGGSTVFKHQQAGKRGGNDDYICTNFASFVSLPFVKDISEW